MKNCCVPDRFETAPSQKWAVYYEGTIYGHSGRDRAGTEVTVGKEFRFAGRTFLVPAVYSCAQGLVVDFCMRTDVKQWQAFADRWKTEFSGRDADSLDLRERLLLEAENPLLFHFIPEVTVNGKTLHRKTGSSICYIPGDPSEPETRFLTEHYRLDPGCAWSFVRANFPWKTSRRPEIRTLELTMTQEPVKVPGPVFEVSAPGEQISLNLPGHSFTLTVKALEAQVLELSGIIPGERDYPTHYSVLTCTVSPEPEPGTLQIEDLAGCDRPRQPNGADGDCEAAAIALIGGADGPSAVCVSTPQKPQALTACSALHFEPPQKIRWLPVLHVTDCKPLRVTLI